MSLSSNAYLKASRSYSYYFCMCLSSFCVMFLLKLSTIVLRKQNCRCGEHSETFIETRHEWEKDQKCLEVLLVKSLIPWLGSKAYQSMMLVQIIPPEVGEHLMCGLDTLRQPFLCGPMYPKRTNPFAPAECRRELKSLCTKAENFPACTAPEIQSSVYIWLMFHIKLGSSKFTPCSLGSMQQMFPLGK